MPDRPLYKNQNYSLCDDLFLAPDQVRGDIHLKNRRVKAGPIYFVCSKPIIPYR